HLQPRVNRHETRKSDLRIVSVIPMTYGLYNSTNEPCKVNGNEDDLRIVNNCDISTSRAISTLCE
ncbi:hypothetical protein PENTCL1PPCAC_29505, partial [Pristionchus entomophagus]